MFISCNQSIHYHSIKTKGSIEPTTQALLTTENLALQGGEEVSVSYPALKCGASCFIVRSSTGSKGSSHPLFIRIPEKEEFKLSHIPTLKDEVFRLLQTRR